MKLTSNRLLVKWIPTMKVGSIHMPESVRDYENVDSVQMFKVVAAGPGKLTRKGIFVPNEIQPGDNVIVDGRLEGRPEPFEDGLFLINKPDKAVIGVCPVQATTSPAPDEAAQS